MLRVSVSDVHISIDSFKTQFAHQIDSVLNGLVVEEVGDQLGRDQPLELFRLPLGKILKAECFKQRSGSGSRGQIKVFNSKFSKNIIFSINISVLCTLRFGSMCVKGTCVIYANIPLRYAFILEILFLSHYYQIDGNSRDF